MKNTRQQQFRWSRCHFFPETFKTSRKIWITSQSETAWNPTLMVAGLPGRKAFFEYSIPVQFYPEIKVADDYQLDPKMIDEVKRFVDLNMSPFWITGMRRSEPVKCVTTCGIWKGSVSAKGGDGCLPWKRP
jgi:hypothetical protein